MKFQKECLEKNGDTCPHCGSENISQRGITSSINDEVYPMEWNEDGFCHDCKKEWELIFKLFGIREK